MCCIGVIPVNKEHWCAVVCYSCELGKLVCCSGVIHVNKEHCCAVVVLFTWIKSKMAGLFS